MDRGWRLATAESLTAGLLAASLTAEAGASAWFAGGAVVYEPEAKTALLGVPAEEMADHGLVSAEVASAMAEGARRALGCEVAVALTGVAGPGPADGVPAGTVWMAVASPAGTEPRRLELAGGRVAVREGAVRAAMEAAEAAVT